MKLPPFLLDHWLATYEFATPPIRFNLASSTGPAWTVKELFSLGGGHRGQLDDVRLSYAPPQGSERLRERIAQFYGVDPEWVIVTTGASEALSMLQCMASEDGATMLLPSPSFPATPVMAKAWGLGIQNYELHRDDGYRQTAERILAAVDSTTRLVLVNTPHNPTGSVMAGSELVRLARTLGERDIPLIVDEVYHPLYFKDHVDSAARASNAIVVSDFSKAFSLSGLRLGWIIDQDAGRRKELVDLRSYFTISSSPLTEAAACHALANLDEILKRLRSVAGENLGLLEHFMKSHGDVLGWIPPAGGTVAFPWIRDGRNSRHLCEQLAHAGVLVAPGDCFGAPEHFRVGVGAQASGFGEALRIAGQILSQRT